MATTTTIRLTPEQIQELATALRVDPGEIPSELGVVSISREAGTQMGIPQDMQSKFSPALLIT